MKKRSVNEIKDFICENCSMKRLKKKDLLLLGNKLIEKISDPRNDKEHYQSFIRKKKAKSVKQQK